MVDDLRQAGAVQEYKGRGVWVPHGQRASWIMEGAAVLERNFDVPTYAARAMVRDLLEVILPLQKTSDNA